MAFDLIDITILISVICAFPYFLINGVKEIRKTIPSEYERNFKTPRIKLQERKQRGYINIR